MFLNPQVKLPSRTDLPWVLLFSCNNFEQPEHEWTSFIAWFSGWNKIIDIKLKSIVILLTDGKRNAPKNSH